MAIIYVVAAWAALQIPIGIVWHRFARANRHAEHV